MWTYRDGQVYLNQETKYTVTIAVSVSSVLGTGVMFSREASDLLGPGVSVI